MFNLIKKRGYGTYRTFKGTNRISSQWFQSRSNQKIVAGGLVASGVFYISNLEEAPVTKRKRFMIVSKSIEQKISDYSYRQVLAETSDKLLPQNHPITLKVQRIMKRLIEAASERGTDKSLLDFDWQVHVVNDPTQPPNAFILPGGKVFVFSSILNVCGNDDGLATVLSHELSHQLARHNAENLSKAPFYFTVNLILYTITGSDVFNSLLVNTLVKMPASREMETEADYIGLMVMSKACFNPREAISLWERMKASSATSRQGRVPEFLSTHPDDERRIENMRRWMGEAEEVRANSGCDIGSGLGYAFRDAVWG